MNNDTYITQKKKKKKAVPSLANPPQNKKWKKLLVPCKNLDNVNNFERINRGASGPPEKKCIDSV